MSSGKALVTGGAGFIGSNLVEALVSRGGEVRVVNNFLTGRRENLAPFVKPGGERIDFIEGDLTDPEVAARACDGVEVVYHLAALPGVPHSMERPAETARHNVLATVNVLAAAKDAGVRRVVFSSSSSVYGGDGPFPQREDAPPRPMSPYAASKLSCEWYCRTFAEAFGTDVVSLRYFNVFGPRQPVRSRYSAVFPAFITRMLRGERPVVHGDGHTTRDFTYVGDIVRANVLAAERGKPFAGEVINIGAGERTDLLELVSMLNRALGTDLEPVHEAERPGDVPDSLADTARARELLGYAPAVGIAEGLELTIDHFRARKGEP